MDAYSTASKIYYISVEENAFTQHSTVKFFARQPQAAVDARRRWQSNTPVAIIGVDTQRIPYAVQHELAPAEGIALASLFDEAARGAAWRLNLQRHG
jgi:hypothetical protein